MQHKHTSLLNETHGYRGFIRYGKNMECSNYNSNIRYFIDYLEERTHDDLFCVCYIENRPAHRRRPSSKRFVIIIDFKNEIKRVLKQTHNKREVIRGQQVRHRILHGAQALEEHSKRVIRKNANRCSCELLDVDYYSHSGTYHYVTGAVWLNSEGIIYHRSFSCQAIETQTNVVASFDRETRGRGWLVVAIHPERKQGSNEIENFERINEDVQTT